MEAIERRTLLKRSAVGAAVVWSAPVITSSGLTPAAAASGPCEKWGFVSTRPLANNGWANEPILGASCTDKICASPGKWTGNTAQMIGLNSDPLTNSNWNTLDFAAYFLIRNGTISLYIYESGSYKTLIGTINVGDLVCIERDAGGTVRYSVNGLVVYTSATTSLVDLYADSSFYSAAGYWSGTSSWTATTC